MGFVCYAIKVKTSSLFAVFHVGVTDKCAVVYLGTYKFMWALYVQRGRWETEQKTNE